MSIRKALGLAEGFLETIAECSTDDVTRRLAKRALEAIAAEDGAGAKRRAELRREVSR